LKIDLCDKKYESLENVPLTSGVGVILPESCGSLQKATESYGRIKKIRRQKERDGFRELKYMQPI
jgi:hypothetical protein